MRLDRFLGDVQMILWKPRYLIKDYVTEWGAAVKQLRRQSEGPRWGKSSKTYNFNSLWWLFAEGGEGRNPMLGEYLHDR